MEIWKDIPGYEGLYQVSNLGNIYSLPKKGSGGHKGKILIQTLDSQKKYYTIILTKNKKGKTFLVHRLIGITFILNKENKRTINHKNGITTDNRVENLEWNTYSENHKHAFLVLGRLNNMLGKLGKLHHGSKKVNQYDLDGNFIKTWDSISDINRFYKISHNHISNVCNGNRNKTLGCKWEFI